MAKKIHIIVYITSTEELCIIEDVGDRCVFHYYNESTGRWSFINSAHRDMNAAYTHFKNSGRLLYAE